MGKREFMPRSTYMVSKQLQLAVKIEGQEDKSSKNRRSVARRKGLERVGDIPRSARANVPRKVKISKTVSVVTLLVAIQIPGTAHLLSICSRC